MMLIEGPVARSGIAVADFGFEIEKAGYFHFGILGKGSGWRTKYQ
ncbi:MAG: hypothetical protein Q9P14_17215 [candidate division KSB1 bacterium]|nr:hypothetical protein [candidate division KSB1 bacterium]MDQ7062773.1 hypothetical protein [candidate division KSB1 bacterium]